MALKQIIEGYLPCCEQEREDKRLMLRYLQENANILLRENEAFHFTASSWIVNPERTRVLMLYHNIYHSWAWSGGHADGDGDLLHVALREAMEETGLTQLHAVSTQPISLEILPVAAHFKRGKYVAPHLHLNLTYLIEADDRQPLRIKADENSDLRWFTPEEAVAASTEEDMQPIYCKLNRRLKEY